MNDSLARTAVVTTLFCLALTACGPPIVSLELSGDLAEGDPRLPDDDSLYDIHRFEARRGDDIAVALHSENFDAYLFLLNPDGEVVAFDDDSGEGPNSAIQFRATSTGQYVVIANAYAPGATGAYELEIQTTR